MAAFQIWSCAWLSSASKAESIFAVECAEQGLEASQQSLSVSLDLGIGKLAQIFDVPDQVGQAELDQHGALSGVFAVGGVIVTSQNLFEVFAQDPCQDLGAAGRIDLEDHKAGSPKTPDPVTLAVVFVSGLIGVQVSLCGQQLDELSIGPSAGLAGFAEKYGDIPPRDYDADHVLAEIPNPGIGSMDFALEVNDQTGQARPAQARLDDGLGQGAW
jgi:hypothetical protein